MRKTFSFIVLNACLAAAALLFLVPSCLCAQGTSTVDRLFPRFTAASAFDVVLALYQRGTLKDDISYLLPT